MFCSARALQISQTSFTSIRLFSSLHCKQLHQHHDTAHHHHAQKPKFELDTSAKHVLALYKRLLQETTKLPTQVLRAFTRNKIRTGFRDNKKLETNSPEQILHIRLALTHIDDIRAKVLHYAAVKVRDDRISEQEHQKKEQEEVNKKIQETEQQKYDKQWKSWE